MRGRKPKPPELRERVNKKPPTTDPDAPLAVADCPAWLGKVARAEWARVIEASAGYRALTSWDRAALAAYCVAWERWTVAEQHVQRGGLVGKARRTGVDKHNPFLSIANAAHDRLVRLAGELRLTPVSRARAPIARAPLPDADAPPVADQGATSPEDSRALLRAIK